MDSNVEYTDTLPDRASELIRLALADLRKVEAMPNKYIVCMSEWHSPVSFDDGSVKCSVCLAGAVLAQSLKLDVETDYMSIADKVPRSLDRKIDALNALRQGEIESGMGTLMQYSDDFEMCRQLFEDMNRNVTHYSLNRDKFHEEMNALADELEKLGH